MDEGCMFCGKDTFNKYIFSIDRPIKNVYVDEEVRDLLGQMDFSHDNKICLPCVCLVHTLCNFKQIMKSSLISYPKDGAIVREFKTLYTNLSLIPYFCSTDDEIDDYKNKSKNLEKTVVLQKKVEPIRESQNSVGEQQSEDDVQDEMLSVMYSENLSRAYSPTSQEIIKSFKNSKKKKSAATSSMITRAKSAPCEITAPLPCDGVVRRSTTPFFQTDYDEENSILYPCLVSICYHHFESFDQLLHHVMSEHGLQQNDLNFEEYKQKLEEYLEKKNSKLKFNLTTSLQMEITKDIENKYPCLTTSCYKQYKSITDLNHHKINDHNLWPRYPCLECYKVKFTSKQDLQLHNYKNHFIINSYCIYCSEPLKDLKELAYHLETHEAYKYPCKYCDKFFFSSYSARQHGKIHKDDKYKQKIERPRRKTILKKYVFEKDNKKASSEKSIEFSRVRVQDIYESRNDEIIDVKTPDDLYIISSRHSFEDESTSSHNNFDDFTVPDVPSDNEGSTISDYINKTWTDINNEYDLNPNFDIDKCDDASTFSDYINKKLTNEEDTHSEITDNVSTISEFIKKRCDASGNSDPQSNKKITVLSEFLVKEGKVSRRASQETNSVTDDDANSDIASNKKGIQATNFRYIESVEISSNTEILMNPQDMVSIVSTHNQNKDTNAKALVQIEENLEKNDDSNEVGDKTIDPPDDIVDKPLKSKDELTYIFDECKDEPIKLNYKSKHRNKDKAVKTSELHKQNESIKKNLRSAKHDKSTKPHTEINLKSSMNTNKEFSLKRMSGIDLPMRSLKARNKVFNDESSVLNYDETSTDNTEYSNDGINYAELEKKFNLKDCTVILEDCSLLIRSRLNQTIKKIFPTKKRPRKPVRRTRKRKHVEIPSEPAKIDASSFERFAAERLGLELDNPFADQNITLQADFEIPCAETVEVIADETHTTELNLLDPDGEQPNEDELEDKSARKRPRKEEVQLLEQSTPLQIQDPTSKINEADSPESERVSDRKAQESLTVQKPTSTEDINIITETDFAIEELESSSTIKQIESKEENVKEPEIVKTKIKRLGMTDIIKRTIPDKTKGSK